MLKAIVLTLLLTLTINQLLPCASVPTQIIKIRYASTNSNSSGGVIAFNLTVGGQANFEWRNPTVNETAVLVIGNWTCDNYSLLNLNFQGSLNTFNAVVANNQNGIISGGTAGGGYYVFAQVCNDNQNFQVQLTSLTSTTFTFIGLMSQGNYNNLQNNTCDAVCTGGVAFAIVNGITQLTQFVCGSYHLFAVFAITIIMSLF